MIDMERIDDDNEYTWTDGGTTSAVVPMDRDTDYTWINLLLVGDGGRLPDYDLCTEDEKMGERLCAMAAEIDDMRRRLAAVETWQQLSRGD